MAQVRNFLPSGGVIGTVPRAAAIAAACWAAMVGVQLAVAQEPTSRDGTPATPVPPDPAGSAGLRQLPSAIFGSTKPDAADSGAAPAGPSVDDEIIVRRRRPQELRAQIELAESTFYERFNAINGDHELDIVCRDELLTGTRIPRRECQPRFERDEQAAQGADKTRGLQGSQFTVGSGEFAARAFYKRGLLQQKMRKLVAEDPQLREALMRYVTLQEAYKASLNTSPP